MAPIRARERPLPREGAQRAHREENCPSAQHLERQPLCSARQSHRFERALASVLPIDRLLADVRATLSLRLSDPDSQV